MTAADGRPVACKRCGALIRWSRTERRKPMPLDAAPNPDGNVAAYTDAAAVMRSRVVTAARPADRWEHVYMPHVVTCAPKPRTAQPVPPGRH